MNQEKIGKFICACRKEKKMTQSALAEKIGVTEKSISNWENGRNMPDLSLFKPLCKELDISINDLISGEKVNSKEYQEKLEENIVNTLNYTNKKIKDKNNGIAMILIIFGILITLTAFTLFPSESSWGFMYSIVGVLILLIGVNKRLKTLTFAKRVFVNIGYFIICTGILIIIDYLSVLYIHQAPRFSLIKISGENMIIYKAPFYNVYRMNVDSKNEYYIVDSQRKYTEENIPKTPFNRDISGIDNILKYKNKYLNNNANVANLISHLPLKEFGYEFQMDSVNLGLTIDYNITDWYANQNNYIQKSLIYNSVSIFALIENVEYITFNFRENSYHITRKQVKENYPNYNEIVKNNIDKNNFNEYLESKMNDEEFIHQCFSSLFP